MQCGDLQKGRGHLWCGGWWGIHHSRDCLSLCRDAVENNESKGMRDKVSRCCGPVRAKVP